jgi:hypothetical protein
MDLNKQLDDSFNEEEMGLEVRTAFLESVKWSKGLVIIIGVSLGLSFLMFLGVALMAGEDGFAIFLLAGIMCLGGIPFYYLYQFTTNTKKAIESLDDVLFTYALKNLKSFFKFWGILTLFLIAYYVLIICAIGVNIASF